MHGFGPRHDARGYPTRDERFEVTVTFDARRGYIASAPELRHPIVALSLASLRKRIEIAHCPTTFASCCSSMVSPSANGTVVRRRRS